MSLVSCIDSSKLGASGKVTYVVDGDTFDVDSVGRVRLADIDTPEIDTQEGQDAKNYVENLIDQKVVYLDIDDKYVTGYYGRYIAVVYVPYNSTHLVNLNQLLLKTGYAEKKDFDNEFNPDIWETSPMEYIKIPSDIQNEQNSRSESETHDPLVDYSSDSNKYSYSSINGVVTFIIGILLIIGVFILIKSFKLKKKTFLSKAEIIYHLKQPKKFRQVKYFKI